MGKDQRNPANLNQNSRVALIIVFPFKIHMVKSFP